MRCSGNCVGVIVSFRLRLAVKRNCSRCRINQQSPCQAFLENGSLWKRLHSGIRQQRSKQGGFANQKELAAPVTTGPPIVNHYNLYPSAELNGATVPGVSSGQAIEIMDGLGSSSLPATMGFAWTELTLQQILASEDLLTKLAFPLGVLFVFLVLSPQYESWTLPVAIILIVPM